VSEPNTKPPRLPAEFAMQWFGSMAHPQMQEIADLADGYIRWIAKETDWDLTAFDGLTFTDNYAGALASIDRGKPGMRAPQPTTTEYGSGSAMTVGVMRGDQLRFRVVVHVSDLLLLLEEDGVSIRKGLYTLAHELAHVELSASFYLSFPGAFGAPPRCGKRFPPLFLTAFRAWDEFAASRYSANYRPEQDKDYEQVLRSSIIHCSKRVNEAFVTFDKERKHLIALHEVHGACEAVVVAGSYLMGHLAGGGLISADIKERIQTVTDDEVWVSLLDEVRRCLEQLWGQLEWQSEEVFATLAEVVRKAIALQGVAVGWRENEIQAAPVRSPLLAL